MSGKNIFESFAFSIAALTNTGDGFLHLYGVDITKKFKRDYNFKSSYDLW